MEVRFFGPLCSSMVSVFHINWQMAVEVIYPVLVSMGDLVHRLDVAAISSLKVFTFPVASGDVVVTGTDGLFDNLYDNEISALVVQAKRTSLKQHTKLGFAILEESSMTSLLLYLISRVRIISELFFTLFIVFFKKN